MTERLLPILGWLPAYRRDGLLPDFLAGLAVWAVMVPEGMAYAGIVGVPPIMGLYTIVPPLIAYALLGTSRLLVVGLLLDAITPVVPGLSLSGTDHHLRIRQDLDFATVPLPRQLPQLASNECSAPARCRAHIHPERVTRLASLGVASGRHT